MEVEVLGGVGGNGGGGGVLYITRVEVLECPEVFGSKYVVTGIFLCSF